LEIEQLRASLLDAEREISRVHDLEAEVAELKKLLETLVRARDERDEISAERDEWHRRYGVLVDSTSWKLTKPLRRLGRLRRAHR
jgi:hypothetical protein